MPSAVSLERGAELLRNELAQLKNIERPRISEQIAEARSHGDLSENADYDAAKERQGFIEGRIAEIENKLAGAQVIDPSTVDGDDRVVFGATVEIEDVEAGTRRTWRIVGDDEADVRENKVSVSSPLARALIGKEEGDSVEVQAPGGVRSYEIVAISYD